MTLDPEPTLAQGTKRHVWTTPSKQGRFGMCAGVGCGHVSGLCCAALRTAGPDAIRSLAPKQIYALEWRITPDGPFQAPGSMQHQYGLLFSGLDRHKAHCRPGHGLADRRGVGRVGFAVLDIRRHV